jgi:hypothetical protein
MGIFGATFGYDSKDPMRLGGKQYSLLRGCPVPLSNPFVKEAPQLSFTLADQRCPVLLA